jgi:hypothetical protein
VNFVQVGNFMLGQGSGLREQLAAVTATVRLLVRVRSGMVQQAEGRRERLWTLGTNELSISASTTTIMVTK